MIPRLAVTGFTFAQSFLATALLNYLDSDETTPVSHGYGLLGACVFIYIGIAVIQPQTHTFFRTSQLTSLKGVEQFVLALQLQVCVHGSRRLGHVDLRKSAQTT